MARAREARTSLPAELDSAGAARRFLGSTLQEWSCDTLADSALLLVSELVTNAVLHARSRLDLVVRLDDGRLRVEVQDRSEVVPTRKHYSPQAATGRGLLLVEQLASEWGVEPLAGHGKRVWFELGGGGEADDAGEEIDLDTLERMLLGPDAEGLGGDANRAGGAGGDPAGGDAGTGDHRAGLVVAAAG